MRYIAVTVICYNNENEVLDFAKNLSRQSLIDHIQLLVTCNLCNDIKDFRNKLTQIIPSVMVFDPGKNLGYLPGCLYGIEKSQGNYSWVMISNTDISFPQENYFEIALAGISDEIWCIGPCIKLAKSGECQNPFLIKRPSKARINLWCLIYSCYSFFRVYFMLHSMKKEKIVKDLCSQIVYAVHGSCFFLKKDCVSKIIGEKIKIFMYGEELLVAELVRECEKKCWVNLNAVVLHNENRVTSKIGSKKKQFWFNQSFSYLKERFFNV